MLHYKNLGSDDKLRRVVRQVAALSDSFGWRVKINHSNRDLQYSAESAGGHYYFEASTLKRFHRAMCTRCVYCAGGSTRRRSRLPSAL